MYFNRQYISTWKKKKRRLNKMEKINDILEDLKGQNELKNHVLDYYINNDYGDYDSLIKDMEDLQQYGCISGMVNELIYYDDTSKFFDKYKNDINEMLKDTLCCTGLSIEELFGDKYDKGDPLFLDYLNKNLLAWFGFEETSRNIYEQLKDKTKYQDFNFEIQEVI